MSAIDEIMPGQFVEVTVIKLADFGAFVETDDGIGGLIHIQELSWRHVNDPRDVVSIGERITVKVLDVDRDRWRASFGLRQALPDPIRNYIEAAEIGETVSGIVVGAPSFGLFVEIAPDVQGYLPADEHSYTVGQPVSAVIVETDFDRRRILLDWPSLSD